MSTFEEAFFWALNYNGWEIHTDAMTEYLDDPTNRSQYGSVTFPNGRSACVTKDDVLNDRPNSILWMCLVMMFGSYGSSPRYGWIERPDDAVAWLRKMQRKTYHGERYWEDDKLGDWCDTDAEILADVARFETEANIDRLREAMNGWNKLNEEWEDEYVAKCEDENGGKLSDTQHAGCLRAYARSLQRLQRMLDEAVSSGAGNPLGIFTRRR